MNNNLKGHVQKVTCLNFLNQRLLVSASLDQTVRIWDTILGGLETVYKMPGQITLMSFTKNLINVICNRNTFVEINSENHKIQRCIKFPQTNITSFIINVEFLIFGTINGTIEVYDLQNLNEENI